MWLQRGVVTAALFLVSWASGASQEFRWEVNKPFATFTGTQEEQQAQVDAVLRNTNRINSMTMFIAADTAYVLRRVEDAGFLFHAATARAVFDLERYPPVAQGGNSPSVYVGFLSNNAGQVINPATTERSSTYSAIAKRLAAWDCSTIVGYSPGWEHRRINSSSESCERILDQRTAPMREMAKLFENPEYAAAFQVVRKYNLSSYKERNDLKAKTNRDAAFATMVEIETRMGIKGFAAFTPPR